MAGKSKARKTFRCAIYTRKSTEHGLDLEFNSLDAQREACEAYIKSQASEGWQAVPKRYDDPAYSGGNIDRPALQRLLKDIEAGLIDVVVVYKIDRLTRSLADFAKLVEVFDCEIRLVRRRHAAVQHHHLHGPADAQCAAVLRPVRARAVLRAGARQGRRLPQEGQMDRRQRAAGLSTARTRSWSSIRPRPRPSSMIFQRYLALKSFQKLIDELDAKGIVTKSARSPARRPVASRSPMAPSPIS